MAERLDFTLVFLRERRFLPAPARQRIRAIEQRYERIIERVIEQGIAAGEFRADLDPRMATLALLGLGNSAAAWYGREPSATLERITSELRRPAGARVPQRQRAAAAGQALKHNEYRLTLRKT